MFSMIDVESAQERRSEWLEKNREILSRLFNNSSLEEEYSTGISVDIDNAITFGLKEKYFKDDINEQIGRLESILERLEREKGEKPPEEPIRQDPSKQMHGGEDRVRGEPPMEMPPTEKLIKREPTREPTAKEEPPKEEPPKKEPPKKEPPKEEPPKEEPPRGATRGRKLLREDPLSATVSNQSQSRGSNILLIHSQDKAAKEAVLKFIETLGLRALTLHEEPNPGSTLVEKFGKVSNIHFAIILFTPDGIAPTQDQPGERKAWVSQNMIFEFGYFVGKLGPGRVCVLYKEGMKITLDDSGVVNIPMDSRGGWRLLVAKEIKQTGIEIDLNKAI
jgi:predicted nucleotide-binding protein